MPFTIQRATSNDAQVIADLIKIVFEDELSSVQLAQIIQKGEHTTYLAFQDSTIVGFIDGFLTTAKTGFIRVELDLLAVHPDYRGQGIAKKLIQAFTEAHSNYPLIRALVATKNTPMHHTMQSTGYKLQIEICALYVMSQAAQNSFEECSHQAHLIPVETLTYRGIWLEGQISTEAIQLALKQCHEGEIVGAVLPYSDQQGFGVMQAQEALHIGDYQWWFLEGALR